MTINTQVIRQLEKTYGRHLPDDLKRYLFVMYTEEPFPHEYSEQDLRSAIWRDIQAYEAGSLDLSMKAASERWQEERQYLKDLYVEKCQEHRELLDYVAELEDLLSKHGLESSQMAARRKELSRI